MNVLFLCGGLEPGKDGVGDYTRKLAGALIQMGHRASIISINDSLVAEVVRGKQVEMNQDIFILRLPASLRWKNKLKIAEGYIDSKGVDWISLQYVPYSFHKKGLPFGLNSWLKKVGGNRKWHIMFHELWLGIKREAPPSHYVYGFIQKRLISSLVKTLSPSVITTSNRVYQLELQKRKIQSKILPLFSNIAFLPVNDQLVTAIFQKLSSSSTQANEFYMLGGFSSVHHGIDLKQVILEQKALADGMNKKLVYLTFGRSSFDNQAKILQAELKGVAVFCNLGELSEQDVSTVLQILTTGVCGTPKEYIGKSGVYAAMKRHNLPVIVRSGMIIPEYEAEIENFNAYLESREAYQWDVKYISSEFYENIR